MDRKIDYEKIERQAKDILDKFAKELAKVEDENNIESYVDRKEFVRVEGKGIECGENFKELILKNAPNKDNDFIIAEKANWK